MASHAERLKTRHGPLMRTLHGEIRRHPGGYVELARELGRPAQSIINMFNPNSIENAPALDLFLDVVEVVRARAALAVMASGLDLMVVEAESVSAPAGDEEQFRGLVAEVGDVLSVGTAALADHRFDAAERLRMANELSEMIAVADSMRRRLLAGGGAQ